MGLAIIKSDKNADIRRDVAYQDLGEILTKKVAFDGSAGNGAIGTVKLFKIEGMARVNVVCRCTESLVGSGAEIEMTAPGVDDLVIETTNAEDLDVGEIWADSTPTQGVELASDAIKSVVINGDDIELVITVAAVTDGELEVSAFVTPLVDNTKVTAY